MEKNNHYNINSIAELHAYMNIKNPAHPLVSVVNFNDIPQDKLKIKHSIVFNFYVIYLKKNFDGKIKYGQQYYDFNDGVMTFFAPKQTLTIETNSSEKIEGWMLAVHPDFIQGYSLTKKMKEYGFFSYATNEALHVSDKEENIISGILQNLLGEIESIIDNYTQDVVVSQIDLLLNYCNRFYNRQFITRKKASNDLFLKFEEILTAYYQTEDFGMLKLPSVQYFADQLFVSPHYLNDLLKKLTGLTTQQHIQNQLIEKSKELLSITNLSVSEIAYQLGFEYPQSFSKIFKNKTNKTPLEFRNSFN